MISNIRSKMDGQTVLAEGPRFNTELVLDAAEAFVLAFVQGACAATPGLSATLRFSSGQGATFVLDDEAYRRVRRAVLAEHQIYDVGLFCVIFDCGPYRIRLYPLGGDALMLRGAGSWRTMSDAPGAQLDPTPCLHVVPSGGENLLFPDDDAHFVDELLKRHAPSGTSSSGIRPHGGGTLPGLRFPHEAFGNGYATLRIALIDYPRLP